MSDIFEIGPVSLNCERVGKCVREFVKKRTDIDFEKINVPNLFNARIKSGFCEFSPFHIDDLWRTGRQLEVRFAIAIAITHPEVTVGVTKESRDNGADIVVKTSNGYIFFDTKDSKYASTKMVPKNLKRLSKFKNWKMYVSPSKRLSYNITEDSEDVQILSIQNAIINMSKSAVLGTVGDTNLAIVERIEQEISRLS